MATQDDTPTKIAELPLPAFEHGPEHRRALVQVAHARHQHQVRGTVQVNLPAHSTSL